ncbi:NAD(P)-binding protein [Xylariaceae sp. FL0255]|nr:NAD(P)-binding protein [Xylariaceae sp. FL0255]
MPLKTVLITGCSAGGIGAAIAATLAKHGHHVFASARDISKIPEELSNLSNVNVIQLDVSSTDSVAAAAAVVKDGGRGLDVLVNNAGAGYAMPILDIDIDKAQKLHDTNLWGTVRMVQAFAGLLIESRGRVINMSTIGAILNMPWISTYTSSKAALTLLSETLRLELAPFGISVVTIMGGILESHFHDNDPFKLPPNSRYAKIEDTIAGWASGKSKPEGMTAERFSEVVLKDIVDDGQNGVVWRGPNAGSARIASRLMPTSLMDYSLRQGQGLAELEESIAGNKT